MAISSLKRISIIGSLFLILILSAFTAGKSDPIDKAREAFPIIESETVAKDIIDGLEESSLSVALAYRGAITSMLAEFSSSPIQKLAHFNEGKALLEKAVRRSSSNPEIRYVRLMVQTHAPSFLGYSDNVSTDLSFFVDEIEDYALAWDKKTRMIEYVLTLEELNESDRSKLESLKN